MRNSFAFAVTLHRVFDSAPPKAQVLFFAGTRRLVPVEKPDNLYVFLHHEENPITVSCEGFLRTNIIAEPGKAIPAILYPDRFFAAPAGWRLVHGTGEPDRLLYLPDSRYELKLTGHEMESGFVKIRSREGLAGGCLMLEAQGEKEIALILEKQSPDIFYVSRLYRDYTGGSARRVYCARTGSDGAYYLAVPQGFDFTGAGYSYI